MKVPPLPHRYLPPAGDSRRTLLLLPPDRDGESALLKLGSEFDGEAGRLAPCFSSALPSLQARDMTEFVRSSAGVYGFGMDGVVAIGIADGASVAASLLLGSPEILAAILLHPAVPLPLDDGIDLSGKAVFLSASEDDPTTAPEEFLRLHRALHRYGARVTTGWFPQGESLPEEEIRAVANWFTELEPPTS